MIFRTNGDGNYRVWIGEPPFNPDEAIPGARLALRFSAAKADPRGFDIEMNPFYDTRKDSRINNNPKLERWIIEQLLKNESGINKYYRIYDPEDEKVELTQKELKELKVKADQGRKKEDLIDKLKKELQELRDKNGPPKQKVAAASRVNTKGDEDDDEEEE